MKSLIPILMLVLCANTVAAVTPSLVSDEVDAVLLNVQASACEFSYKGSWHGGAEASTQLRHSFDDVKKTTTLQSTEQFIEYAASENEPTGSLHLVRCSAGAPELGGKWLAAELTVVRDAIVEKRSEEIRRKAAMRKALAILVAVLAYGGVFPLIVGGIALIRAGRAMTAYKNASTWPQVPATVLYSLLHERSNGDGTSYEVEICCSYETNGRRYETSRHTAGIGSYSYANAERAVQDIFPAGTPVVVSVDPLNPENAILDTGCPWEKRQEQRIGLGMFSLGAGLCLYAAVTGWPA